MLWNEKAPQAAYSLCIQLVYSTTEMLFDEMQYGFELVLWEWFAVFWVFVYPPWILWETPSWSEWIQDRAEGPSRRIQYHWTKPFVSLVKMSKQEADEQRNLLYPEVSLLAHVFI